MVSSVEFAAHLCRWQDNESTAVKSHLFVYGSLVGADTLNSVLGRRFEGERLPTVLRGYQPATVPDWDYPVLVEQADASTQGVLLMDVDDEDLERLDAYEEVEQGAYRRATVEVEVCSPGSSAPPIAAWVYLIGPTLARRL